MKRSSQLMLAVAVCSAPFLAWAQGTVVGGIYTCVDAQGRKLTSDRPIPECLDREQKVLNPSGTVAQKIGPSLTAAERAQKEAKDKQEQEANNRTAEDRRRDKALLMRFPNRAAHDRERAEAVAQSVAAAKVAVARLSELGVQRKKLDDEMEFYHKDPTKAPQYLRRQVEENHLNMDAQKRLILDQEEETKRINTRFDAELTRLRQLWPATTTSR